MRILKPKECQVCVNFGKVPKVKQPRCEHCDVWKHHENMIKNFDLLVNELFEK